MFDLVLRYFAKENGLGFETVWIEISQIMGPSWFSVPQCWQLSPYGCKGYSLLSLYAGTTKFRTPQLRLCAATPGVSLNNLLGPHRKYVSAQTVQLLSTPFCCFAPDSSFWKSSNPGFDQEDLLLLKA
ncbi:hypothetical protein AV530_007422 [Patagioenas fasciata monilis]|uniref:Uncharacterized protein n=1 Tax=Patagioenas fasciata monilis TaxID=372326 RepID=A0A1V4JZB1_PATFA|nr:hypothetical protein AV530_007422 [Patagioenas fasciata monilis]